LLASKKPFFSYLRGRWQDLFGVGFEVLLYDLTSTYFESDPPVLSRRLFHRLFPELLWGTKEAISQIVKPGGAVLDGRRIQESQNGTWRASSAQSGRGRLARWRSLRRSNWRWVCGRAGSWQLAREGGRRGSLWRAHHQGPRTGVRRRVEARVEQGPAARRIRGASAR